MCTSRNAIVVVVCAVLAYGLDPDISECEKPKHSNETYNCTFLLTGTIQSGLPGFHPPPFSIPPNATDSGVPTAAVSFTEMISTLGSSIIIIPIIAILESIAIAKAFCECRTVL